MAGIVNVNEKEICYTSPFPQNEHNAPYSSEIQRELQG